MFGWLRKLRERWAQAHFQRELRRMSQSERVSIALARHNPAYLLPDDPKPWQLQPMRLEAIDHAFVTDGGVDRVEPISSERLRNLVADAHRLEYLWVMLPFPMQHALGGDVLEMRIGIDIAMKLGKRFGRDVWHGELS